MSKLVAVYGDETQLERALSALQNAGLSDNMRVIRNGHAPDGVDDAAADRAGDGEGGQDGRPENAPGADPAATNTIPAVIPGGGGVPPVSPAVLDPLAVPPGGSRAVGVVGEGPGELGTTDDLRSMTGADADEARYYSDALSGGASLLVVEGDDRELDRAEAAMEGHRGQGMVRR